MRNKTVDDILPGSNVGVDVFGPPQETERSNAQIQLDDLQNKEEFFKKMFNTLYLQFCNFTRQFIENHENIKDIVQEAMINMYKGRESYDMKRPFRPWAFTVLANCAKDYLRKIKRKREICESQMLEPFPGIAWRIEDMVAQDVVTAEEVYFAKQDEATVNQALDKLKEPHREILELYYFKEFSYEQIAIILNIPVGTVKSRKNTAVANFKNGYMRLYS